jgi:GNAT superfamily N-acetyltransferase
VTVLAPPAEWGDALYLPRARLSGTGGAQRFGSIAAEVTVTDTPPDSIEAQWLADRAIALVVDDQGGAADLAGALPAFRAYATALTDRPATALLTLPSRDVDRCRAAREGGFAPQSVMAVCPLPRAAVVPAALPVGVSVRLALPEDADEVVALWHEQARYEARLGTLRFTPAIGDAMARRVPAQIAGAAQVLVAERDDRLLGALVAEPPESSAWAGERLSLRPVSYLVVASTAPAHRGTGVGGALVRELHRRLAAEGVRASVLHCSAHNPLAIPFWSQHGYRPVLTTFTCAL